MKALILTLIVGLFSPLSPEPLDGFKWDEKHVEAPRMKLFAYVYGSPSSGSTNYHGKQRLYGMSATIILGPSGLGQTNCFLKYEKIVKFLNKKYGRYLQRKEKKDFLIEELIYSRKCHPLSVGLIEINTIWKTERFQIEAWLFGSDDDIHIEIEYYFTPTGSDVHKYEEKQLNKVL